MYKRQGGIPRIINDDLIYQSPFLFAVDNLNLATLDASNLAISKSSCAFPVRVMLGQVCEFEDENHNRCTDGYINSYDNDNNRISGQCPECNGTGLKTRLNPMVGILLKPKTSTEEGDVSNSQDPFKFVTLNPDILKFLDEQIDKHISRARKIIHLPDSDEATVKAAEGSTATGSSNKLKSLYSFVKPISDQTFDLYEFILNGIGVMRYGSDFDAPKVNRPTVFDFKTEQDYLADLDTAIKMGISPLMINTILFNYLKTFYYTDTVSSKVLMLLTESDRLFGMTRDEIIIKASKGLVAPWEDILHSSGVTFVQELLLDNENYFEQDFTKQQEQLIAKAQAKALELRPVSLTDSIMGVGDEGKSPSAGLSGSVGGLTGMIEIVKAVSSGIYDYDAAVALVVQRFGLSDEEARKQLGSPKKIQTQAEATQVATVI